MDTSAEHGILIYDQVPFVLNVERNEVSQSQQCFELMSRNPTEPLIQEAKAVQNLELLRDENEKPDFQIRTGSNNLVSLHSKIFLRYSGNWRKQFKQQVKKGTRNPIFDFPSINILDLIDVAQLLYTGKGTIQFGTDVSEKLKSWKSILECFGVPADIIGTTNTKILANWEKPHFHCIIDGMEDSKCSEMFYSLDCEETQVSDVCESTTNSSTTNVTRMSIYEPNDHCRCEICGQPCPFLSDLLEHMKSGHHAIN